MIATVTLSIHIGVILTENLEFILGLSYDIFEIKIDLERQGLICVYITVTLALTFRAIKFPLLGDPL